jgi:hypothetical protein
MSWVAIAVLVAVIYVCVLIVTLALLRAAKRADEAPGGAEAVAAEGRRFAREEEIQLTPEDAAFLERLGRR